MSGTRKRAKKRRHHQHNRKVEALQSFRRNCCRIAFVFLLCLCMLTLVAGVPPLKLEPTQYSEIPNQNIEDSDTQEFQCPAPFLEPFFTITRSIMSAVVGYENLPPGYTEVDEINSLGIGPKVRANEWGDLITHNWLVTLIVVTMFIIAIVIPIVGLYICIRECFEDDSEEGLDDDTISKKDIRVMVCGNVVLGILTIGILFGFVAAFVTSNYLELAEKDYKAATLATVFFATTSRQINHMLISNYTKVSNKMQRSLHATMESMRDKVTINSMELSRRFINNYHVNGMQEAIAQKLEVMLRLVNKLNYNNAQLGDVLRGVRRKFCSEFIAYAKYVGSGESFSGYYLNEIGKINISVLGDHNMRCQSLPRIKTTINDLVTFFNDTPIITGADHMGELDEFVENTFQETEINIKQIIDSLVKSRFIFKKAAKEIQLAITKSIHLITAETVIDDIQSKYDPYRFCVGIVVGSMLLLIWICLLGSLLCGICGWKNSSGGRNKCCNRSDGALFLMGVAVLIFAFITLITLSALGHFLPGIIAFRVYCDSVSAGDRVFDHMIVECRKNASIFVALNAKDKRTVNIEEIKKYDSEIKELLVKLKLSEMQLEEAPPEISQLFTEKDMQKFETLKESHALLNLDEGRFTDMLESQISHTPITELFDRTYPARHPVTGPLMQRQINYLDQFNEPVFKPIVKTIRELNDLSHEFSNFIITKHYSMQEEFDIVMHEYSKVDVKCLKCFIDDTLQELSLSLRNDFESYTTMIFGDTKISESISGGENCYELAAAYDTYRNSICCAYVDLICGFWVAIMWCLLLFLPILWLSFKLANIYHRVDPYPDPYQEVTKHVEPTASTNKIISPQPKELIDQPKELIDQPRRSSDYYFKVPDESEPIERSANIKREDITIGPQTVQPNVSNIAPVRRSTFQPRESRPSLRPKEADVARFSIKRKKSRTSVSSSSSSDVDIIIKTQKTKKD